MEKDLIIKYLEKEIRFHDCLIIPGLGGFIGSYESAYFDQAQGKYFPPSKALIFNANLQNNDGLLANFIKDGEGISYVSALTIIENTVAVWQKSIEEGQRIEIGDFGYIYKTRLGHIQFYQNKAINLYPGSYGLSAVTATGAKVQEIFIPKENVTVQKQETQVNSQISTESVSSESKEELENIEAPIINLSASENIEEESKEDIDEKVIVHPATRKFKIPRKYIVAASFIPFMFYSVWIPLKTDFGKTHKIELSDFNPFVEPVKAKYEPRNTYLMDHEDEDFTSVEEHLKMLSPGTKTFSYQFDEDCYIPVKLEGYTPFLEEVSMNNVDAKVVSVDSKIQNEDVQPNLMKVEMSGHYHIIAGCFGEKANADNLVASIKAKGYDAQILDQHKGLYRVSASGFASKEEAIDGRSKMKNDGISGWVLKY
ncbi:MAG: SPOR domain-containing protein [Crocinitomicaceae bacterium]